MQLSENAPFANPARRARRLPDWLWGLLRVAGIYAAFGLLGLLAAAPQLGVAVFWLIAIPGLPLLFLLAPGLWRNICPMAVVNQLPKRLGLAIGRPLPLWLRENAYLVAVAALFGLIALRHPLLNHHAGALFVMIAAALVLAFLGGLIFEGKSGWCGTFCPMAPLERAYGQSPLVLVPNRFCAACDHCQKNCYDINPNAAIFKDLDDASPWYVGQRKLFIGALPGVIVWFFSAPDPVAAGYGLYFGQLALTTGLSLTLFFALAWLAPQRLFHFAQLFSFAALGLFYGFGAPVVHAGLLELGIALPPIWVPLAQTGVALLIAATWLRGLHHARAYRGLIEVEDRASGRSFRVARGQPLLEAIEGAGIACQPGCRQGQCGSDPVLIKSGWENLDPPGKRELATLRALGLEGKARMACMCAVNGPVAIDVAGGQKACRQARAATRSGRPQAAWRRLSVSAR